MIFEDDRIKILPVHWANLGPWLVLNIIMVDNKTAGNVEKMPML